MTRRLVLFASFDKDGLVRNYVVSYLRKLKAVAERIVFVADNTAEQTERDKLNGLADIAIFQPHGEYDFGSYKRGLTAARESGLLNDCDELILCNDSCFAVGGFERAFDEMGKRDCDFWAMTSNREVESHLQSYFLVFKKPVFENAAFVAFFDAVKKQKNVRDVVLNYEIPLQNVLEKQGFKGDALLPAKTEGNPIMYPLDMLDGGFLVKRKVFELAGFSRQSVRKTLARIKAADKQAFADITDYCGTPRAVLRRLRFKSFCNFLFRKKKTRSGGVIVKVCKIPVWASGPSSDCGRGQ